MPNANVSDMFSYSRRGSGELVKTPATQPAVAEKPKKPKVPRPSFAIYVATVTDAALPERANFLNLSVWFDDSLHKSWNIKPQRPVRTSITLTEERVAALAVGAVPLAQAIKELEGWLARFNGKRIAVCSAMDFWHVTYHTTRELGKNPFTPISVDVNSYVAGAHSELLKQTRATAVGDAEQTLRLRRDAVKAAVDYVAEQSW